MKAVRIHEFGEADVLAYEDAPAPEPGDGELLVEVHAASVNPVDIMTRRGAGVNRGWKEGEEHFPAILGWDVSGVVAASNSDAFAAGDEVMALSKFPEMGEAYAELATVRAAEAVAKPAGLSHAEAASVPLVALTAWQALIDTAKLEKGQTVLLTSTSGGVGQFAVQIAKHRGAHVIGVASARNEDFAKSLGVDEFLDYASTDVAATVRDMDVVFHMHGGFERETLWQCLKPSGFLVSIVGFMEDDEKNRHEQEGTFMSVRPNAGELAEIVGLIDDGSFRVTMEATYPLAQAADAHRHVERGHNRGKVVLTVRD